MNKTPVLFRSSRQFTGEPEPLQFVGTERVQVRIAGAAFIFMRERNLDGRLTLAVGIPPKARMHRIVLIANAGDAAEATARYFRERPAERTNTAADLARVERMLLTEAQAEIEDMGLRYGPGAPVAARRVLAGLQATGEATFDAYVLARVHRIIADHFGGIEYPDYRDESGSSR